MNFDETQQIMPDTQNLPLKETNHVSRTLKLILLGFSLVFWAIGGLFCAIGGYVTSQTIGYEDVTKLALVPGAIISIVGIIIFIMSTFGVLGSLRENIRFLNTYKIFLIGILFFEVFCGFVGFAFWPEVKKVVDQSISKSIREYTSNALLRDMIDKVQRELSCCGSLTIDDWDSNEYFSCRNIESYMSCGVPWSCCHHRHYRNRQCGFNIRGLNHIHRRLSKDIFLVGCKDKAFEFFKKNMKLIGGLAVAATLPIIIGIFLLRIFVGQIRRNGKFYIMDDANY